MVLFAFVLLTVAITMIYLFLTWNFTYWSIRGIKGPKPLPLFGSFPGLITKKQHFADDINNIYRKYKNCESYVGVFLLRSPLLMLLEPQLVHDVFVTSFRHFNSNDVAKLIDRNKDPLLMCNPFVLSDREWHIQRSLVSPGFTISRIRTSYYIMQLVSKAWCEFIKHQMNIHSKEGLNGKDIALRFTSENIAKSVLGIGEKTFTDKIMKNVKMLSENNNIFNIYAVMAGIFPKIINTFKVKFIPNKCEDFFMKLIQEAFRIYLKRSVKHRDFMDHLMSLKKSHNLSDENLISHTMTFLIDGLDTSATVISHCLFLLGRYQTVQKRLLKEILKNSINGELCLDKLNELPYLNACIYECIRILPPGLWSIKRCTAPYTFTNKNGEKVSLAIGDSVMIPIYAIHQDENYYYNPDQFHPERFLTEDGNNLKSRRNIGSFLGFGDGPRMCLGINFATIQTKVAIASVVCQFSITLNAKTKPFVKLDPKHFLTQQDGGVWLNFCERN
ncbi:probable cytochrome P450 28c1 isoform X1 [Zeugodacus cucurbitae]|uniref:probable cytochrome P450 28c1 isoform X1 n=1 Tax=Zeugodacus cucurbitae TaxID=28588 RepID=UPI0023D90C7A|nr:probable cytochrome P450 28c1 isoform X1 [Zeugodacus cucurbitae]